MTSSERLIPVSAFCSHHHISVSFIEALAEQGIIICSKENNEYFLDENEIYKLEQAQNLHEILEVNIEGIDVVFNLLQKMEEQNEMLRLLRNRLAFYETEIA